MDIENTIIAALTHNHNLDNYSAIDIGNGFELRICSVGYEFHISFESECHDKKPDAEITKLYINYLKSNKIFSLLTVPKCSLNLRCIRKLDVSYGCKFMRTFIYSNVSNSRLKHIYGDNLLDIKFNPEHLNFDDNNPI